MKFKDLIREIRLGVGDSPYDSAYVKQRKSIQHGYNGSPRDSAASTYNSKMSAGFPVDYFEESGYQFEELNEEDPYEANAKICELRVFKDGMFKILETMEKLVDEDIEEEDEDKIDEFSGAGAAGGVAVPLGREADGSFTTRKKLKQKRDFFKTTYGGDKSKYYPYKK